MERKALSGDLVKSMMGTVLAYITFAGSMYGAVYLPGVKVRLQDAQRHSCTISNFFLRAPRRVRL
jgi:hypothetical protein